MALQTEDHYSMAMNAEHRSKCEALYHQSVMLHMDEKFTTGNKVTNYQRLRRCCDMYMKEFMTLTLCRLVYAVFLWSRITSAVSLLPQKSVCAVFWCKSVSCEIRMIHVRF